MVPNAKQDIVWKALLWVCGVLVTVNISAVGYALSLVHDVELRIAAIEASRFTNREGGQIYQRIADLEKRIAQLPKEIPPPWFKEFVRENRSRIKELEAHARRHPR
jgi:hypothetical protein